MTTLDNKPGMVLQKGYSIRLEKDGRKFHRICLGVSWGSPFDHAEEAAEFGLNAAVTSFAKGRAFETICFRKLRSRDGAINYCSDDAPDIKIDDEVMTIDLPLVNPAIDAMYIYLNTPHDQDFVASPIRNCACTKEGLPILEIHWQTSMSPPMSHMMATRP